MKKNKHAVKLGQLRWRDKTPEERTQYAKSIIAKRWKKKNKKKKKDELVA